MNVLVVDDDADVADSVAEIAVLLGFAATPAYSMGQGLAALDRSSPDVVICDFELGDGTGEEVLRYAATRHERAWRVLMTSSPHATRQRLLSSGLAHLVLVKPFSVDELKTLLRRCAAKLCA